VPESRACLRIPTVARLLSRRAVEHAAQFSWEHTTDRLLEVYTESMIPRTVSPTGNGALSIDTASSKDDLRGLIGVPAAVIP